jgi:hypothetical protein
MKQRHATGPDLAPGDVVARAYRAANRGRFAEANKYVLPTVWQSTLHSAKLMRSNCQKLAAQISTMRDQDLKERLAHLLAGAKQFRDPHHCWKLSTRCGSIRQIESVRERIRRDKATVTLTLRLDDGTVVTEREPLVRTTSGWRIGSAIALQNNEMQLTKSATARRRGLRS